MHLKRLSDIFAYYFIRGVVENTTLQSSKLEFFLSESVTFFLIFTQTNFSKSVFAPEICVEERNHFIVVCDLKLN